MKIDWKINCAFRRENYFNQADIKDLSIKFNAGFRSKINC